MKKAPDIYDRFTTTVGGFFIKMNEKGGFAKKVYECLYYKKIRKIHY